MIVERLDPSTTGDVLNRDLHLARYAWAAERLAGGDVLDLACGVGYGSAMLAEAPGRPRVLGLDRSEDALATARDRHADERVSFERIADASALDLGARRFDAVVSLETLEHLDRPLAFLRRAHAHLAPGGVLVVSAPTHEAPGDNPYHMNCFTPETLRAFVSEGFTIEDELDQLEGGYITLLARRRETPAPAWTRTAADAPRFTVVVVTWNKIQETVELVSALRAFTRAPFELVVVDNASTDGTRSYLRLLEGEPGVRVVANDKNLKCAAASNQGIARAGTDAIVYLCASHALVLREGWEEPVLRFLEEKPDAAIAGDVWNPGYGVRSNLYARGWTPERHGLDRLAHVQGGAFVARKRVFDEHGLFHAGAYPHEHMDVELGYRLLSRGVALDRLVAFSCPASYAKPDECEAVTVVHPASDAQRALVRERLGWKWPRPGVVLDWEILAGEVAWLPQGGFALRAGAKGQAIASSRAVFSQGFATGTFKPLGERSLVVLEVGPYIAGRRVAAVLGPERGALALGKDVVAEFNVPRGRVPFAFGFEGGRVSLSLAGARVADALCVGGAGPLWCCVRVGEAVFSDLSFENTSRP